MRWDRTLAIFTLLVLFGLAGCQPQPTATPAPAPTPTLTVWKMLIPAELDWMRAPVNTCETVLSNTDLVIVRTDANIDMAGYDFVTYLGEPPSGAGARVQVAKDQLVVIANPENPITALDTGSLLGIFQGSRSEWPGQADMVVTPYGYHSSARMQRILDTVFETTWQPAQAFQIMPGTDELTAAVSLDKTAIGLVTRHALTDKVTILELEPEMQQRMLLPVYLLMPEEPGTIQQSFIDCIIAEAESN